MPERLKGLREAKHFSQEKLAELSGLSQSLITKAENGRCVPTGDALEKLASALDCTIDYVFGRWDEYDSPEAAASRMSFAVFEQSRSVSKEQLERCRRVLEYEAAPKTAAGWRAFAEMIEMSIGSPSPSSANLTVVTRRPRSGLTK
jgi:transcriptional regulator with XRE-family HTH domain